MKRLRTWQIHISNIKFRNEYERKDPFLRINVGWDFQPLKVFKQGPWKQDKDGKLYPVRVRSAHLVAWALSS